MVFPVFPKFEYNDRYTCLWITCGYLILSAANLLMYHYNEYTMTWFAIIYISITSSYILLCRFFKPKLKLNYKGDKENG